MSDFNAYEKYQQQAVSTHTPGELIVLLYDKAIFHMNQAIRSIDGKKPAEAHISIRKAQDIVLYLRGILDLRYEVSGVLDNYYQTVLKLLSKANIYKEQSSLEEAIASMRTIRTAWKQVETQNHQSPGGNKP